MTETVSQPARSKAASAALVVAGVGVIVIWITAHIGWAFITLMANVMANDSGAASAEAHQSLIAGMLGGQILAAAAGVPAGLACFWRRRRKALLWLFLGLFVTGALAQAWAFSAFFSSAS
jgi:hypothetical protein